MVTLQGKAVKLYGRVLDVGQFAPIVHLTGKDFAPHKIGGATGKYQLISVIPSIDGGVCQTQTRTFYKKASSLANVEIFCVSVDIPFALDRFCVADGISNISMLSDYKDNLFGKVYGLLLTDGMFEGLLTRAVIIVNAEGKIVYQEICKEIADEPDYDAALQALQG